MEIRNSEQGTISDRTLDSIKKNYREYLEASKQPMTQGDRKKLAAQHKNCVRKPLLDIELDMVVPMYLHILLGNVWKQHGWLVEEAHAIDEELAVLFSADDESEVPSYLPLDLFKEYIFCLQQKKKLGEELVDMEGVVASATTLKEKKNAEKRFSVITEELAKLSDKKLKKGSGPVAYSIEETLAKHKIESKAWHGGAFIGNHCAKYLNENVYTQVTDTVCKKTASLTENLELRQKAEQIKQTFDTLFASFAKVHDKISNTNKLTQDDQIYIQESIDIYMNNIRKFFPEKNVTPKMHILENHVVPFLQNFNVALGRMSEQGGELIHASMVKFSKRTLGIRNPRQ